MDSTAYGTGHSTGHGVVLDLVRTGRATTRRELIETLGWSRTTLAKRLDDLIAVGLLRAGGQQGSQGGRPPQELGVVPDSGVILGIDVGGSHTRVAVTDLISEVLVEDEADIGLPSGPEEVFVWAVQVFDFLLRRLGRSRDDVRAVGVGVPGPVHGGRLGTPQLELAWDGVAVPDLLAEFRHAVVAVDRDVNVLALGEHRLAWPEYDDLLVVKVGMGVGLSFVLDGRVRRGSRGGAGEASAPRTQRTTDGLRRLESVASGRVLQQRLASRGLEVSTSAAIVALARSGDPELLADLDEVGETIGLAVADVVALLNPAAVVVAGNLADAGDRFLAAIRSGILGTTHPFARRGLVIERGRLGEHAGVRGASLLAQDALFAPARIDRLVPSLRNVRESSDQI